MRVKIKLRGLYNAMTPEQKVNYVKLLKFLKKESKKNKQKSPIFL